MTNASDFTTNRWPKSARKMSFGFILPNEEDGAPDGGPLSFAQMLELVRAADTAGFEITWTADHYTVPGKGEGTPQRASWEGMVLLNGLAATTRDLNMHYGPLVACTSFRTPIGLAKIAEGIDAISDGKFILGLGAGWNKPEYDALGLPFDHRVGRFEEAIEIIAQFLRDGTSTLDGQYYQTDGAINWPRGPRADTGGPPILVGSTGERMLRIMARYADAWNGNIRADAALVKPLIAKVHAACDDAGRDTATMTLTAGARIDFGDGPPPSPNSMAGSDDEIAEKLIAYRDIGIDHLTILSSPMTTETVERLGGIIATIDKR